MNGSFLICAAITTISSVVSLGFSVAAVRPAVGDAKTLALYACARSLGLVIISAGSFITGQLGWLYAAAVAMIIVQGCDAMIGLTIKDRMKTVGPAVTALVNFAALLWLAR